MVDPMSVTRRTAGTAVSARLSASRTVLRSSFLISFDKNLLLLSELEGNFSRKYRLKSRGFNFEKVAEGVSSLFDLEKDDITARGRQRTGSGVGTSFVIGARLSLGFQWRICQKDVT
jgi:hypothetical protein